MIAMRRSRGYWEDVENQRYHMDLLGKKLGHNEYADWYKIKTGDFRGNKTLLLIYNGSPQRLLRSTFPEHQWKSWSFLNASTRFWGDIETQKVFCEKFAAKFGIKKKEDWYGIRVKEMKTAGGYALLHNYNGSLYNMLKNVYPKETWHAWLFQNLPRNFWQDQKNVREFVTWIEKELGITQLAHWNKVSYNTICQLGGRGLLTVHKGLKNFLRYYYPAHDWNAISDKVWANKSQQSLFDALAKLFSPTTIMYDNYLHPTIRYKSGRPVQLDVYIPSYSLAFEYQGEQHYHSRDGFPELEFLVQLDNEKKEMCRIAGVTLIEIPYWWDATISSLYATIQKYAPAACAQMTVTFPKDSLRPILETPPASHNPKIKQLSELHPYFSIPLPWTQSIDPTGWWISPVPNGVRCMWNSFRGTFSLQFGRLAKPSEKFMSKLPTNVLLDGILSCSNESVNLTRYLTGDVTRPFKNKHDVDEIWGNIEFYVLDAPSIIGPIETRLEYLKKNLQISLPQNKRNGAEKFFGLKLAETVECQGVPHLLTEFSKALAEGWEVVTLRKPGSDYKQGRTASHLNVTIENYEVAELVDISDNFQ